MTLAGLWQGIGAGESAFTKFLRLVLLLAGAIVFGFLVVLPLTWPQQAVCGLLTLLIALALARGSDSYLVTLMLMIMSLFCTFRYGYWRIATTIQFFRDPGNHWGALDAFFILTLIFAESYAFLILFLGYFQTIWPLRRAPVALPDNSEQWPHLDVLIPTYNEPLDVVRFTALGALNIDWPAEKLHVYILDDGRRKEFEEFAFQAGVGYKTRPDNKHAKAGNINAALKTLKSPFVAIFDCDHVPTRSFLQVTMGWFLRDHKLAMLQTPHHFYSPDPFERNLGQFRIIPNEGELFYGVVQDGNDFWNATFFCGSCAILRRTALDQIGGIAVETVTEDAHTSLRLQMRGWSTAYINIAQAAGLATERLSAHVGQRIRWARGMIQILRIDNPLFAPGLTMSQRLCYFNAMIHFLYAVPRLIFLTAPLVYLILSHTNVAGYWAAILAYALPHLTLSNVTNSRIQGEHRHSFWNEIYETVLSPYILIPTLLALINPRLGKFNVTAKGGVVKKTFFDTRIAQPFLILLMFNLAGILIAVPRYFIWDRERPGTVIMNVVWSLFNIVILGVTTAVARELRQLRTTVRIKVKTPVVAKVDDGRVIAGETIDMSSGGCSIQLNEPLGATPQSHIRMVFPQPSGVNELRATVVSSDDTVLRVRFENLTLAEQEVLTMVLYSRADSWLGWGESREADNVLLSFQKIMSISMRGLVTTFRSLFTSDGDRPRREKKDVSILGSTALLLVAMIAAFGATGLNAQSTTPDPSQPNTQKSSPPPTVPQTAPQTLPQTLPRTAPIPQNSPSTQTAPAPKITPDSQPAAQAPAAKPSPIKPPATVPSPLNPSPQTTTAPGSTAPPRAIGTGLGLGEPPRPLQSRIGALSAKPVTLPPLQPGQFRDRFSLADAGASQMELHGIDSSHTIYFTLPQTHVPRTAKIHLSYAFSPSLLPQISHLKLMVNGTLVGTVQPTPSATGGSKGETAEVEFSIPPELMVHNNALSIQFIGHYVLVCEDPANTTIWARIHRSTYLDIEGDVLPLADDLKQLPLPFLDPAIVQPLSLPIVFLTAPSRKAIQAAGVVTSYFGMVSENRPVRFPVHLGELPKGNVVLISDGSAKLPAELKMPLVSSPTVAMRTNPQDPYGKVLVVAGADQDQVVRAAQAVALHTDALQGGQSTVEALNLPAKQLPDAAPRWARTDQTIALWDYATAEEMQGDGTGPLNVYFRIPPDLYYSSDQPNSVLKLAYRYNSIPLGPLSSMQIRVNNAFLGSVPLVPGQEASRTTRKDIPVPVVNLRPFSNSLGFDFTFQLLKKNNCQDSTPINMQGSILRDTYLDLRGYSHYVSMPNLEIFANAGFPFTRVADLSDTTVVLPPSPTAEEVEMFVTMMGHFGRQTGFPVLRVNVAGAEALEKGANKDFLVLGVGDDQPGFDKLANDLPVALRSGKVQVHDTMGFFAPLHHAWWKQPSDEHAESGDLTASGTPDGVVEEIESPFDAGDNRSIVAIHLRDASNFEPFMSTFLYLQQASDIQGSVSVLLGTRFQSFRVGANVYHVGLLPWWTRLTLWFSQVPWLASVVVLGMAFLLAIWIRQALRHKARSRLKMLEN